MQIPCVSCQSLFRLDSSLVKATGSLVRCSKCKNIFRVFPPASDDEPIIKDIKMDQSTSDDLFEVEQANMASDPLDQNSEEMNEYGIDEIASIGAFEEEEEEDSDMEDIKHADLSDLSEYDDMID